MASQRISYSNDKELETIWINGYHKLMDETRKCDNVDEEYDNQQSLYSKFAQVYDKALVIENYSGPARICEKILSLYVNNKNINILDYGCGTGLVADFLFDKGFRNIDGYDCNQELLDISACKNHTRKYFCGRDTQGLETIADNFYDVVCSTGVFFLSQSHPGTECFKDLCRIIKPGGLLIVLTKVAYLSQSYVDMTIVDQLECDGILKIKEKEEFVGYRQAFEFEDDSESMGVILTYEIL